MGVLDISFGIPMVENDIGKQSKYMCEICNKVRNVIFDRADHAIKVAKNPTGLVTHADIHRCADGILGINNCAIDADGNIRGIDNLQLPTKRKPMFDDLPSLSIPGIPSAKKEDTGPKVYPINIIFPDKIIRIRIRDIRLRAVIEIGEMKRFEKMVSFITSDLGTIELEYYASDIELGTSLEKWLTIMCQLLEKLPPTTLGLFIETILFIYGNLFTAPNVFLILQLQTLITAQNTYFTLKIPKNQFNKRMAGISAKYGEEVYGALNNIAIFLVDNPSQPLQFYTRTHEDLTYLINLFLILEQEGILSIQRPAVIKDKIDNTLADDYEDINKTFF